MGRIRFTKWIRVFSLVPAILAPAFAQSQADAGIQAVDVGNGMRELVPSRIVDFEAVESEPNLSLPSTTVDYPHCLSDGALVLISIDWDAVKKTPKGKIPKYNEIVTVVQGKTAKAILSASISDLTDFDVSDIFPSDSGIYLLLRGTKDKPGEGGPHKSPSGVPFSSYHNYVSRFDLDGTYRGATELSINCDISRPGRCDLRHLAVFPSGDMLVTEPDPETSTLKVLYLKSSGEVVKQIDVPASRKPMDWGDASPNPETVQAATMFLASVYFTAVGGNIVAWRANSNDSVVEVRQGGVSREVPIQTPEGWRFADMVASDDRWVVHFRTESTPPNVRMNADIDAYYDVRPQDGSLSARLVQKGDIPLSIACESSGTYTSFKMDDAGKMVLLRGR